jgi:hypothetical protein
MALAKLNPPKTDEKNLSKLRWFVVKIEKYQYMHAGDCIPKNDMWRQFTEFLRFGWGLANNCLAFEEETMSAKMGKN